MCAGKIKLLFAVLGSHWIHCVENDRYFSFPSAVHFLLFGHILVHVGVLVAYPYMGMQQRVCNDSEVLQCIDNHFLL